MQLYNKKLKYLWVYSAANEWTVTWHERNRLRRLERGFDITYFCNTPLSLQRRWLPFPELDHLWQRGYRPLIKMYEDLAKIIQGHDVLILYNGANLHPEFVSSFKNILKVYTCADPESSEILARPLSQYFDLHLVNQMSEIEKYKAWGLPNVFFWPLGSLNSVEEVNDLDENKIINVLERPFQASMFCEYNPWRSERLDQIRTSFPNAIIRGKGWKDGYVPWNQMWDIYRKTQIGWNIHNTTGFNFRTYDLLSLGVMQICDNKSDLSKILEIGKEVIGFDTISDCIELSNYFLAHPIEQREIALAGWKRWKKDYTPDRIWDKLVEIVDSQWQISNTFYKKIDSNIILLSLSNHKKRTILPVIIDFLNFNIRPVFKKRFLFLRKIYRMIFNKNQ